MSRSVHRHSRASTALRLIVTLLTFSSVTLGVFIFSTHHPLADESPQPPLVTAHTSRADSHASHAVPPSTLDASAHIDAHQSSTPESDFGLEAAVTTAPIHAVAIARQLAATNPSQARDIGYALIAALQRHNAFDSAAAYAAESPAPIRRDLVIAAFHDWGRVQPDAAWTSSIRLTDATARDFATQSVLSGWARNNPEDLAETALYFPEGAEKNAALTKALRSWMIKDPEKAGDWILSHPVAVPIAESFFANDER
jgi:hypothetical protein